MVQEIDKWKKSKNAEANKLVQSIVSAMIINTNGVSEEIKPIA